ncbi:MAG: hypothetical protein ACI93R_003728 [Flavobacteriales bacterium]|jgi:hypothetical protein
MTKTPSKETSEKIKQKVRMASIKARAQVKQMKVKAEQFEKDFKS